MLSHQSQAEAQGQELLCLGAWALQWGLVAWERLLVLHPRKEELRCWQLEVECRCQKEEACQALQEQLSAKQADLCRFPLELAAEQLQQLGALQEAPQVPGLLSTFLLKSCGKEMCYAWQHTTQTVRLTDMPSAGCMAYGSRALSN